MTRQELLAWHAELERHYQQRQADTPHTSRGGAPDV
jgi:hypothetical protein